MWDGEKGNGTRSDFRPIWDTSLVGWREGEDSGEVDAWRWRQLGDLTKRVDSGEGIPIFFVGREGGVGGGWGEKGKKEVITEEEGTRRTTSVWGWNSIFLSITILR